MKNEVKIKIPGAEITFPYKEEKHEPYAIMLAALDLLKKLHGKVEIYVNDEKQDWMSSQD